MWRSGSQIAAQLLTWTATFFVIRTLRPADYGLYAMTQAVLVMFTFLNGYGFTGALVRAETVDPKHVRQVFGLLLLFNGGIALAQVAVAPLVATYYHQPMVRAAADRAIGDLSRHAVYRDTGGAAQPGDGLSPAGWGQFLLRAGRFWDGLGLRL